MVTNILINLPKSKVTNIQHHSASYNKKQLKTQKHPNNIQPCFIANLELKGKTWTTSFLTQLWQLQNFFLLQFIILPQKCSNYFLLPMRYLRIIPPKKIAFSSNKIPPTTVKPPPWILISSRSHQWWINTTITNQLGFVLQCWPTNRWRWIFNHFWFLAKTELLV